VTNSRAGAPPPAPEGEGWVECRCGARHWGRHGAAGLLLTDGARVVLQHRAGWSHFGGTWGVPGGALHPGEPAVDGALREAHEEAGLAPGVVRVVACTTLHHPDWSYTTVVGRADAEVDVAATDPESLAIAWVPFAEVTDRALLPAFADAWPTLREMADADPHVVVDVANVVGSRPDGWWRDRRGATQRLLAALDTLARAGVPADLLGLPGQTWWPVWHAVVEGAARGVTGSDRVAAVEASGSGDDAIVDLVAELRTARAAVVAVVTADRGLGDRVDDLGATVLRPSALLRLLSP
jgi:8-oxo-dGTP diphosphatase